MFSLYPVVLALLAVGVMWLLDRYLPLVELLSGQATYLGYAVFALGLVLGVWAAATFVGLNTNLHPFGQPDKLVTLGLFRFSRNPMYLAMAVSLLGVGLKLGSLTALLVVPLFVWLAQRWYIQPEEQRMEAAFGVEYRAYKKRVRRWL